MANFILRDKQGCAKITIAASEAYKLMDQLIGNFDEVSFKGIGKKKVFKISSTGVVSYGTIVVHINEDDYLCNF